MIRAWIAAVALAWALLPLCVYGGAPPRRADQQWEDFKHICRGIYSADTAARGEAINAIRTYRAQMVSRLNRVIADYRNGPEETRDSATRALFLLGDIRANDGVPTLVENLRYDRFAGNRRGGVSSLYQAVPPQRAAIASLGLPAVRPLAFAAAETTDPATVDAAASLLIEILGPDFATSYSKDQVGSEADPGRRERLGKLAASIAKQGRSRRWHSPNLDPFPQIVDIGDRQQLRTRADCAPKTFVPDIDTSYAMELLRSDDSSDRHEATAIIRRQYDEINRVLLRDIYTCSRHCVLNIKQSSAAPYPAAIKAAMLMVGETRAEMVLPLLVDALTFTMPGPLPEAKPGLEEFERAPQMEALIRLGLPSLDPLAKRVAEGDDQVVISRAAIVIDEVLGTKFGLLYVKDRHRREKDPIRQNRLARLRDQIDKVERVRKVKPFTSPLELPIFPAAAQHAK